MITLVTGGSGSGKSEYAEGEIIKLGEKRRIYIATMKPWDEECRQRIERHRRMRAEKKFDTVERYRQLEQLNIEGIPPACHKGPFPAAVLLECLSNLVSNELFGVGGEGEKIDLTEDGGRRTADAVVRGVLRLGSLVEDLVIVTNEVFSDGATYDPATNLYRQVLGTVNCRLGAAAGRVVEVAAGIPNVIKEGMRYERSSG